MKLIIIESPFKGDRTRNNRYLRACIRDCLSRGESPYASHRMLTDALDDDIPEERMLGIEAGLAWRNTVKPVFRNDGIVIAYESVVHAFYVDLGDSTGMMYAKKRYVEERIPYEERSLPSGDPFFNEYCGACKVTALPNDGTIRMCTPCFAQRQP